MIHNSEPPRRSSLPKGDGYALRSFAPGGPGVHSVWTTGAKDGMGTSYYDPNSGVSCSNVWYTLSSGTLTEVYYPDVSCANLRTLQLVVSDGCSFTDVEESDMVHDIELVVADALIYRQTNTAKSGKYKITKTYLTDPVRHTLLMEVTFEALVGNLADYQVYVYSNPTLKNRGMSGSAEVALCGQRTYLVASAEDIAMVWTVSRPIKKASSGYSGTSDGLSELRQTFQLTTLFSEALDGNVTQIAQIELTADTSRASPSEQDTFVLSLGFGASVSAAIEAATASLGMSFTFQFEHYRLGWQTYLQDVQTPVVGSIEQYQVAAMVLKAHEDKRHPGAIVASLTIPWGDRVSSQDGGVGGYHLVWSRDFYQVASTLYSIGIRSFAARALAYLDEVQQQPDGSFPQNSWLDGTPYWKGLQLDQVAFPILLADQMEEAHRYATLVKPAADFILQSGPYSPQERWEENAGYSPSTIAAQIAALVVAAKMAREAGDFGSAAVYLAAADRFAADVNRWTVTNRGALSPKPYYVRVSDTQNPDDEHWIEIKNGGGWHKKSEIVDAGFLELVRLGIKAADDEIIVNSLNVVDAVLKYDAPYGPVWKRYNFDGYGEQGNGEAYHGSGVGRPWPLLAGERGEYEVAFASSLQRFTPNQKYDAKHLLHTMAGAANKGYLIPEQVWDQPELSHYHLVPGQGTGSATPLAWAMAQYIRLAECVRQGRIVEMPAEVEARYQSNPPGSGPTVRVDDPAWDMVHRDRRVTVSGHTVPGTTVVLQISGQNIVTKAGAGGRFQAMVELQVVGNHRLDIIAYDNQRSFSLTSWLMNYQPTLICEFADPAGDDVGPGGYTYPMHPDFISGDFDLRNVQIMADEERVYFEIELGHLDNPWEGPSGLSKQWIDIYLHRPDFEGEGSNCALGLNARFADGLVWHRLIRVTGNWHGGAHVYQPSGANAGPVRVDTEHERGMIHASVLKGALGGVPSMGWGIMVLVTGEEDGRPRPIRAVAGEWDFGGGSEDNLHPQIVDMLDVASIRQSDVLDWRQTSEMVRLPMVWIP
jgi:glucan 1,4-alpha-glucosidase